LDIPGVGSTNEKRFDILPGTPMYIDGTLTETTIDFTLKDRYGNATTESLQGTIKNNNNTPTSINFSNGILSLPRSP
jgi:hypothetical protein